MLEWDEDKRQRNIQKHGFDFIDAIEVLSKDHVLIPSSHQGEQRLLAVGMIKGRCATVVYTMRGLNYRIISVRSARRHERQQYQALLS